MSGYGAKEARINKERKPRVILCTCGKEIDNGALLCQDCYEEIHGHTLTEDEGEEARRTR